MFLETLRSARNKPIGSFITSKNSHKTFESNEALQNIFDYFVLHGSDAVILTKRDVYVGILTQKDLLKALHNPSNLLHPVDGFMSFPIETFASSTPVSQVIELMQQSTFHKIVVLEDEKLIGIIDNRDLIAYCYGKIAPLIQQEYDMFYHILGIVEGDEQTLLKMATTDPLTGIGNRRLLKEVFDAHQSMGKHLLSKLFIIMFDIDDFKKINDTFGHNIGDTILKQLTVIVGHSIRKSDILARWGGEEFIILVRHTEQKYVFEIADSIRKNIDISIFESLLHVTCSFGVTQVFPSDTLESAVDRADTALYQAKSNGKNCIRLSTT